MNDKYRAAFTRFVREEAEMILEASAIYSTEYILQLFETGAYRVVESGQETEDPGCINLALPPLTQDDYDEECGSFDTGGAIEEVRAMFEQAMKL